MFAAYASTSKGEANETKSANSESKKNEWLSNSSFNVNSDVISNIQGRLGESIVPAREKSGLKTEMLDGSKSNDNSDSFSTPPSSPSTPPSSPSTPLSSPSTPPSSPLPPSGSSQASDILVLNSFKSAQHSSSLSLHQKELWNSNTSERTLDTTKQRRETRKRERSMSINHPRKSSSSSGKDSWSPQRSTDISRRDRERKRSRTRQRSRSREKEVSSTYKKYQKRLKKRRSSSSSGTDSSIDNSNTKSHRNSDVRFNDFKNMPYYEDRTRALGNLNVTTLSRPVAARYYCSKKGLGITRNYLPQSKRRTLKLRYYNKIIKEMEADMTTRKKLESIPKNRGQIQGDVNDVEGEISHETAKFNHDLAENPQNTDLWRKYVQFQDVVHQFERVYRRGGGASGARVTSERKLAILDKALKENPKSEELLRERCQLAESVLPSDKLTQQLKTWIGTDPGNLALWESLIMASQGSLSACKVPAVKSLYQEAFTNIHSLKRGNTGSAETIEAKLISLVLHFGLFLRQAGLWELMWSFLNVYLEFNIAKLDPTKFHITNTVADNALTELEEAILKSQLPLSTLWLRVETLRAGTHWVPLPVDAESEDPQRLVFPEDVNDLIHPINSPHLNFRLVTVTLSLLKVPILPWRESAAKAAGLHPLPWLLDGPEPLFASLLPLGTLEFKETSTLLQDASQLASGPQYLIARPGQDEYIDFLTQVFSACADCLPASQKTYLMVWWLRFYRWLMQLERLGHCKLPRGRKKKMRSMAKDLLRHESNRSNLLLFKEFALLELENGSVDGAKKVLQGTISALPNNKPVPIATDRAYICTLYRTLVEVHLSLTHRELTNDAQANSSTESEQNVENRKKALSLLVSLGKGAVLKNEQPSNTDVAAALSKFNHVTKAALDNPETEELDTLIAPDVCHLVPTFLVEWTVCHGWLLFLSHSIWKATTMFENVLRELESPESASSQQEKIVKVQREALLESYISLLRHHCFETRGSFGVLREVILRGLKEFPGNLVFSAALADLETSNSGTGLPLWRLSKIFYELNSAIAYVLFVFVMRYRLKQQELCAHNTHSYLNQGGPELPDPNTRNRMSTLLKKLTKHSIMRRCPMLWRLRLQFAAAVSHNDSEYSSTLYLALEDCPWAKTLYMDIVQVLPTQLAQVQDLLVEKELRLHVTPEELEILRID